MRIGVVSDTHNVLRPEVIASLRSCDYILHAGDICCEELLIQLKELGKVCAVRGNNDLGAWAAELKVVEKLKLDGLQIAMCHEFIDMPKAAEADIIINGHSHRYRCEKNGRQWLLNPGSCGRRRFNYPLTWMVLITDKGELTIERHEIKDMEKKQ